VADGVDIRDRDIGRPSVPWQEIARSEEFRRLESLRRRAMLVTLGIFLAVFGTFLEFAGAELELLFVSCTNFRALEARERIEQDLELPVVTSNHAALESVLGELATGVTSAGA